MAMVVGLTVTARAAAESPQADPLKGTDMHDRLEIAVTYDLAKGYYIGVHPELRTRCDRPRDRAAEKSDELAPSHVRHSALFPSRSGTGNNGSRSQLTTRSTCRRGAAN